LDDPSEKQKRNIVITTNNILVIISCCLLTALPIVWALGTRHPAGYLKEKIKLDSIREHLSKWYAGYTWVCVETIEDYPGFMGLPMKVVILENKGQRILLGNFGNKIKKGSEVKLRLRSDEESRSGVWISAIDKFLVPILTEEKKCNHRHEVSSPADTVEVCIHCGDKQAC